MAQASIDWQYWKNLGGVKAWEAVLLSVGIDPQGSDLNLDDTLANHPEFKRRMERLLADLGKSEFFSVVTVNRAEPTCSQVFLEEAAAWCIQSHPPLGDVSPGLWYIGERLVYARQEAQKKHNGRYTLEEAAEKLEAEAGERFEVILQKLKEAALNGSLPVHEPGRNARHEYGPGKAAEVRAFYEEASWTDLNEWLERHEPKIQFRFPTSRAEEVRTSAAPLPVTTPPPISRHASQEAAILNAIRELGHDPKKLPRNSPGTPGVKAAVSKKLPYTPNVFNKAWERLRKIGEIAD